MGIFHTLAASSALLGMNYGRPSDYMDSSGSPVLGILVLVILAVGFFIEEGKNDRKRNK